MNVACAPFEPHVLLRLDSLAADPAATVGYEYLTGGLVWSDELPRDVEGQRIVVRSGAFKRVLAYRASLTLGEERTEFRLYWDQLERGAPNWPGLRAERRGAEARRQLIARIEELEHEFEEPGEIGEAAG